MPKLGEKSVLIDKKSFEQLCTLQCTREEVCSFFDCSYSTLDKWCKVTYAMPFKSIYDQKHKKGLVSLRRKQFQVAMGGDGEKPNVTMLIFLGKNYLKQTDKQEVETKLSFEDKIEDISTDALLTWVDQKFNTVS